MQRWEQWVFNLFHGVVAVTGTAYFVMKYAVTPNDPFAVINHPWQPMMIALHIMAAPIFIAAFGMIFRSHTLNKLQSKRLENRRSGWTSLLSFSAMALTGYLLQVASNPTWVTGLVWAHVSTSLLFVAGYAMHLIVGWRLSGVLSGWSLARARS